LSFSFAFIVVNMPDGESFVIKVVSQKFDGFQFISVGDQSFEIEEVERTGRK